MQITTCRCNNSRQKVQFYMYLVNLKILLTFRNVIQKHLYLFSIENMIASRHYHLFSTLDAVDDIRSKMPHSLLHAVGADQQEYPI